MQFSKIPIAELSIAADTEASCRVPDILIYIYIYIYWIYRKYRKYTGIVYGGSSRKQKKNFQIGNEIFLNWKSKGENRSGYFNVELILLTSNIFKCSVLPLALLYNSLLSLG